MKFKERVVLTEAITFAQLMQFGRDTGAELVDNMPVSFVFQGRTLTRVADDDYLIEGGETVMNVTPLDMLVTSPQGDIYPQKVAVFNAIYEPA